MADYGETTEENFVSNLAHENHEKDLEGLAEFGIIEGAEMLANMNRRQRQAQFQGQAPAGNPARHLDASAWIALGLLLFVVISILCVTGV